MHYGEEETLLSRSFSPTQVPDYFSFFNFGMQSLMLRHFTSIDVRIRRHFVTFNKQFHSEPSAGHHWALVLVSIWFVLII